MYTNPLKIKSLITHDPANVAADSEVCVWDLGSTGIRAAVYDISRPHLPALKVVKTSEAVADAISELNIQQEESQDRIIVAVKEMRGHLSQHDFLDEIVIATESLRSNADPETVRKFIELFYNETGLAADTISGKREAELIGLGLMNRLPDDKKIIGIHLGGGSLDFVQCKNGRKKGPRIINTLSLPAGVRRIEAAVKQGKGVSPESFMQELLEHDDVQSFLEDVRDHSIALVGAEWNRLLRDSFARESGQQLKSTGEPVIVETSELLKYYNQLSGASSEELFERGFSAKQLKSSTIPEAVMRALIQEIQPDAVTFPCVSVRDGVAVELAGEFEDVLTEQLEIDFEYASTENPEPTERQQNTFPLTAEAA